MLYWLKRKSEEGLCLALLIVSACVALYPALGGELVPMELRGPLFMAPWEEAREAGAAPLESSFNIQHSQRYYPWFKHLARAGQGEGSVLWMEEEGFGVPFLGLWRTRVLSPFSLPFYVTELPQAVFWSFLLKLIAAGGCAYYVARRFGFAPGIALFAGIAWQWAAPILLWSAMPLSDVVVWLPLLVLFWERAAAGMPRAWVFGALILALMLLGGDPESVIAGVFFGLAYLGARRFLGGGSEAIARGATVFGVALVAALLAVSVQILPWIEYQWLSFSSASGANTLPALSDLAALIAPFWTLSSRADSFHIAAMLHGGLMPLLLLPLYVAVRPYFEPAARARLEALALVAVLGAVISYAGSGVWGLFPGHFGAQHGLILLPLAMILLTGAALGEWIELSSEEATEAFARLRKWGLGIWAVLSLMAVWAVAQNPAVGWGSFGLYILMLIAVLALLLATLLRANIRIAGYGSALIALGTLAWAWHPVLPGTDRAAVFPETGFVNKLQQMDARVAGSKGIQHWPLAANDVSQIFSPSGVRLKRFEAFSEALRRDPLLLRRSGAEALLLTREDIQGVFGSVRPVLNIQEVFPSGAILFRDLEAKSRARMIHRGVRIDKPESTALSSDALPTIEGASLPEDGAVQQQARIEIVEEQPLQLRVRVEGARPGLLVLTDAWYPGWRAAVNGRAAVIYPVDIVFRGIELGEGDHDVVIWYDPMAVKAGMALSALGLLVMLGGTSPAQRLYRRLRHRA